MTKWLAAGSVFAIGVAIGWWVVPSGVAEIPISALTLSDVFSSIVAAVIVFGAAKLAAQLFNAYESAEIEAANSPQKPE